MNLPHLNAGHGRSCNSVFKDLKVLIITSLAMVLSFCLSCSPNISDAIKQQPGQTANTSDEIHVAFAGGGWRAHTGHSAWVMSLLQANNKNTRGGCTLTDPGVENNCLLKAFTHVKTISANSGGSWFSSMLMYDKDFIKQITSNSSLNTWGDPTSPNAGWLGRQENKFKSFNGKCQSKTGSEYLECVLSNYFNVNPNTGRLSEAIPSWPKFVEEVVYYEYSPRLYGNLNSTTRQTWAKDKTLLMAGSLLTNNVVLNEQNDETYFQTCTGSAITKTDGDSGGSCIIDGITFTNPDALPVTFTSRAENSPKLKVSSFISHKPRQFNFLYSGTVKYDPLRKLQTAEANINSGTFKTDYISVLNAATTSSAAVGFTASLNVAKEYDPYYFPVCDDWNCPWHLRDLSVGFSLSGSGQIYHIPRTELDSKDVATLAREQIIRVADGGVVDNSGIIQLIGYLQKNQKNQGFNIVAFDEVQSNDAVINPGNFPSSDISYLFNGALDNKVDFGSYHVRVPDLKVLENTGTVVHYTWTVDDNKTPTAYLHYFKYEVKTLHNNHFNINGTGTGTIHVFASEYPNASTAPEKNGSFASYNRMINTFLFTLRKRPDNNPDASSGLAILKAAFGLK